MELSVSSGDGFRFSMAVHRRVLASRSRFFAEKLEGIVGTLGSPVVVEICECDDVEVYVEAVAMMYCRDLRRRLAGEEVGDVLGLLKVKPHVNLNPKKEAIFRIYIYFLSIIMMTK